MTKENSTFIDESKIEQLLSDYSAPVEQSVFDDVINKANKMKGLDFTDIATLMAEDREENLQILFKTAKKVKETIYGNRIVMFAPLYISNLCKNECTYCAFRVKNKNISRKVLSQKEISADVKSLIDQGHKRVLLVAGEYYPNDDFNYVLDSIKTVYSEKSGSASIRRVNVNVAPLSIDEFKKLKDSNIGTYQIFQETYHRETYSKVHLSGKKSDYNYRLSAIHRAMEAGIDDVGIGALFGLYNWKFELLAMMQHVREIEDAYGVGPHTISIPRLEPADNSAISEKPPYELSDIDFKKLVAILRLAVPYTGLILSTRENVETRREVISLGISQISAGSSTNPGGYAEEDKGTGEQFSLGDHRSLDEVIKDLADMKYVPSFCTGCYRLGRTGADFMDLAKPGAIQSHCTPNALSTFQEYMEDFASKETREVGEKLIETTLENMKTKDATVAEKLISKVKEGDRDIYC